jgi:excisionase family DNA binding protein
MMSARASRAGELNRAPHAASAPTQPGASRPQPGPATERLAYSVNEAARITGLSRDLLYDQMRQGNLDYIKVGRRRLITRHHLEQFLDMAPGAERPGGINASAHSTGSDAP